MKLILSSRELSPLAAPLEYCFCWIYVRWFGWLLICIQIFSFAYLFHYPLKFEVYIACHVGPSDLDICNFSTREVVLIGRPIRTFHFLKSISKLQKPRSKLIRFLKPQSFNFFYNSGEAFPVKNYLHLWSCSQKKIQKQ